jgi:hypothetical protein
VQVPQAAAKPPSRAWLVVALGVVILLAVFALVVLVLASG